MKFTESITTCFRKYFVFRGRAQRSEFWWWMLFTFIAGIVLGIIDSVLFPSAEVNYGELETFSEGFFAALAAEKTPLTDIFNVVTFIPGLAVGCRRLHDISRSGWWQLLPFVGLIPFLVGFVPLISGNETGPLSISMIVLGVLAVIGLFILLIVWWATDSDRGPNRFGPSPKYDDMSSTFS